MVTRLNPREMRGVMARPSPEDLIKSALAEHESLVGAVIEVVDWLEEWQRRATGDEHKNVTKAIERANRAFISHGVRPFGCPGGQVDLRFHKIDEVRESGEAPGTILEVLRRGYEMKLLGEKEWKVLRVARVVVEKDKQEEQDNG